MIGGHRYYDVDLKKDRNESGKKLSQYYMFNKPSGYITAVRDERRATVMEFFPEELRKTLHPIGRLDRDTHGLLLFTDDGQLDPALMRPEHHVDKEYLIYGIGSVTPEKAAALENGVPLPPDGAVTRPARFVLEEELTVAQIEEFLPAFRKKKYLHNPDGPAFRARLTIREGKKHQVKLMMRAVNCRVCRLCRVSLGGIRLDPALPEGGFRPLTDDEIALLEERKRTVYGD